MTRARLGATVASVGLSGVLFALLYARVHAHPWQLTIAGAQLTFATPQRLVLLALLPLVALVAQAALTSLSRAQRALSLLARCLLLATLILALAQPLRVTRSLRVCTTFVVDVSDSISDVALAAARSWVQDAVRARGESSARLITVAAEPVLRELPANAAAALLLPRHQPTTAADSPGASTDLQAALQLAYATFPSGAARRLVLLSDGNQTRGDLLAEAKRARAFDVQIDYKLAQATPPAELAVRAVELPTRIDAGKRFSVRIRVHSTTAARARVRLYQDGASNTLDPVREVTLGPGETELGFESLAYEAGVVAYRAQLEPLTADHFRQNNVGSASGVVNGPARVLLVDSAPAQLMAARAALERSDFAVEVRSASGMPRSLAELSRFDFVVLSDVPAQALAPASMQALQRYVADAGGGFMMAGGEQSFGPGGYQDTPLQAILPVQLATQRRRDEHSLALALVIDCSGSMVGQKMELAKEAARATAAVLGDSDFIEVIGFAGSPERRVRMQSAANRIGIAQNIARLTAAGGTQIFAALDLAYQDLSVTRARLKHVILLTDGQSQESGISELVQAMRADAITLSTVGLGNDVNRGLLQSSANLGGGRAYFTSDPSNVPRIFVDETTSIERQSTVDELVSVSVREPADFLKGVDLAHAPLLHGYVATQARPAPAQVILQSELGEPILARWHVGLGNVLALTTDLKGHWSADWLRWPAFARFLGQLVREHLRSFRADELPMQVSVQDGVAHVIIDALDADDRFLDGLQGQLDLEPTDAAQPAGGAAAALVQTAPGRYEGSLPLPGFGTFGLRALLRRGDRMVARSRAQASQPYPAEYATVGSNAALLRAVAAATGGMAEPSLAQIWRPAPQPPTTRQALWPWFVALALCLFLIDLWVRRVRLFEGRFR